MKIRIRFFLFFICWLLTLLSSQTYGSEHILYVKLPPDVSRQELLNPEEEIKTRLQSLVRSEHPSLLDTKRQKDVIVILTDDRGQPILPDLETAQNMQSFLQKPSEQTSRKLTFTFDSPYYPWSAEELNILDIAITDFYPVIESIYGEPAFDITLNVRKDPTITFSGEYSPTLNELVLRDASHPDVLCHEMIHAFRDDSMIRINNYEEGMTRAAEVEVFNRLAAYTFWNENHSYMYDVYYEGLNRQVIGSQSGNFDYASPFLLLRYDLAGYAWAKVLFENSNFFVDFNRTLYTEALLDPSVLKDESQLRDIAGHLQPVVEGKPFHAWYEQQGILDPIPPVGYYLYQNISNFNVYYFYRDSAGSEAMQPGEIIEWEAYDYDGLLMDKGSDVTSSSGWISINPVLPDYYNGRIKITATVLTPDGMISNTSLRSIGMDKGIFGIVDSPDSGFITITPLDEAAPAVDINVVHGSFAATSLANAKGRFIAIYADEDGKTFSKHFNKDASDYFLYMVRSDATADLSISQTVSPGQATVGENLTYIVVVNNNGPDTAFEVVLRDILPDGVTFISATPAQGSCAFSAYSLVCALNALTNGSSIPVKIVALSTEAGNIQNIAHVTGNVSDPDMTNNTVGASSTVVDIDSAIKSITSVTNKIDNFVELGIFNRGQGMSLLAKLQAAKNQIKHGNTTAAINQLHAFTNQTHGFVRAGILSPSDGEELIIAVDSIIAELSLDYSQIS